MPVITISRQLGAGGGEAGRRVAELLGLDLVDSAVCAEVARRLQLPEEAVRAWDERRESLILRLLRTLQDAHPESAMGAPATASAFEPSTDPDRVWESTCEVIREEAKSGKAVIIGRGGAMILADWPGALHFRLIARKAARLRRVIERLGCAEEEAARLIEKADRDRAAFLRQRFNADPEDPTHYALVLNTGILGIERAARLMSELAAGRSTP